MLSIYTRTNNPFSIEFVKFALRSILNKKGGPDAVFQSLILGLKENGVPFRVNPLKHYGDTAIVLSGPVGLDKILIRKEMGEVKILIAGPNIALSPSDNDNQLNDDRIDVVLVPSDWTKGLWSLLSPKIESKIKVWPAGVNTAGKSSHDSRPIILNKRTDRSFLEKITHELAKRGDTPLVLNYGSYTPFEYFEALSKAPYLIYIASSESQGLALQEAWAHDVPTFVAHCSQFEYDGISWSDEKIAAPYLCKETGAFFRDEKELFTLISDLSCYSPKNYCDAHLSNKESTRILLKIIDNEKTCKKIN